MSIPIAIRSSAFVNITIATEPLYSLTLAAAAAAAAAAVVVSAVVCQHHADTAYQLRLISYCLGVQALVAFAVVCSGVGARYFVRRPPGVASSTH